MSIPKKLVDLLDPLYLDLLAEPDRSPRLDRSPRPLEPLDPVTLGRSLSPEEDVPDSPERPDRPPLLPLPEPKMLPRPDEASDELAELADEALDVEPELEEVALPPPVWDTINLAPSSMSEPLV